MQFFFFPKPKTDDIQNQTLKNDTKSWLCKEKKTLQRKSVIITIPSYHFRDAVRII